jgi:hypothetical protein
MPALFHLRTALPCLLLLGLGLHSRALDGPTSFTLDLPFSPTQATPAWLGHPVSPPGSFATLELPIVPPEPNASLLVTVFFQEKVGGFLRIGWVGEQDSQVLSDNFYDGIGMSNQRSLLVTPETMKNPGSLDFQCGDAALGIQRVQLEWLENQTGLTSPAITDVLVTPANGQTTLESNVNGQPQPADTPAWKDRIVHVPVTDAPLRIEQGVEFNVELESLPSTARLAMSEAGLPWGQHLAVWINGKLAGTIAPSVPDLNDGGYASRAKASTPYVGWRDGSLFLPVSFLTVGNNTLQFSPESDDSTAGDEANPAPLAVKNVDFQFDYPATAAAPAATNAAPVPSPALSLFPDPGEAATGTTPNAATLPADNSDAVPTASDKSGLLTLPASETP